MSRNEQNVTTGQTGQSAEERLVCCPRCGATYDIDLPKCPYCEMTNPIGAEKAYMNKLHGVHRDLKGLRRVMAKETKRELKETGGMLKKTLLILALVLLGLLAIVKISDAKKAAAERENYVWEKETFPVLDEYYAQGDQEAIYALYQEALQQGRPIYRWEHTGLCEIITIMEMADRLLETEKERDLVEMELQDLLWCEATLKWLGYRNLPEEDRAWVSDRIDPYLADMEARFPMTQEEEQNFENSAKKYGGILDVVLCEQYIKEHS